MSAVNLINETDYKINELEILKYFDYLNQKLDNEKLLSVVLVENDYIKDLNMEFRQIDAPTDVLSFEAFEDEYLGDIIISVDKIKQQALDYDHSEKREFYFLMTHGFLHLNGYDHMTKEEEVEMFALQKQLLDDYEVKR